MLPKKNRTTKKEVEDIFKKGSTLSGPVLFLKYFPHPTNKTPKVSFVVPKKVAKLATERNKLKRMGYNALTPLFKEIPPYFNGIFTFKYKNTEKNTLIKEIEKILNKIN